MASPTVSVTVTYSKPGTQPPIYLAGSFSKPEWQPEEMQYTTGENNEHEFHKKVEVEPGKEYQYKFRLGAGDWWTLNEDSPTVTDDLGNKNNLLSIPKVEETTTNTKESFSTIQEFQAEQAEPAPTPTMEKEKTPSIEETMGTRETDDTLFADEIVPDTNEAKQEQNASATEGIIEPHATPAIAEEQGADHVEEVNHTKELQDIRGTDTSVGNLLEEEDVIEPTPTPLVDFKKIHDLEDVDSQNVSDDQVEEDKAVAPPALVVENAEQGEADKGDAPLAVVVEDAEVESKQDDASPEATTDEPAPVANHSVSADLLTTETPTENISRIGARTPDLANVAAEVADVAATLDPEEPTPPVSDEEAGRTGFRRMSATPIPQVALTAAEVADSAAIIDKEAEGTKEHPNEPEEFIRPFDIDDGDLPETPPNEKVPRFSHECPGSPPVHESPCQHDSIDPYEGMIPTIQEEHDLNDPSIKMFPTDRAGILDHLRQMQERLPADEVKLDLAPPSPVVGPNGRPERLNLPAVSPVVLAQRSPSLDSIPEQNDGENGVLEPTFIKLNGEDKPNTNGITVPKEEIEAIIGQTPKKENETPFLEPERKGRDLVGSVDGNDEISENVRSDEPVTGSTESDVVDAFVAAKDDSAQPPETRQGEDGAESKLPEVEAVSSAEESKETTDAENQNAEPTGSTEESTGGAELSIPDVIDETAPAEEPTAQHGTEKSMDGIFDEGLPTVPAPITPFIVGNRQLGHEDEDVQILNNGSGPTITIQPATPFPGIDRQLDSGDEHAVESSTKDTTTNKVTEESSMKDAGSSITELPATPGSSSITDTTIKHNDEAKSTAIEDEDDQAGVKLRKRQPSPIRSIERPITPSSVRSNGKDPKDIKTESLFKTIFRVVFVEWIGGFLMRLCGGRRRRQ